MVHRPSDSRLLNGLLSNEKEYHKQLLVLVDNYSRNSLGAFSAYASASPAPIAHAVIAVAGSLAGADDALRYYAASVEAWQAELRALKELEEEVGNVIRDREILVTRLIKLSKNQKPTRDSFIGTLGSSAGDSSQTSLNSFTSPGASSSKFGAAQAELQACEVHLAAKEKELDELRVTAVRRGLEARCKAMVECGWSWGEMGKEGLRALEGIENSATDGPSQSASQVFLSASSLAVPTDQPASTPPRVASPASFPSRSSSPHPHMPSSSSLTLKIPPAHSISELALPSTLERRISEEPEDADHDSSEEDSRPVEVVENTRFASAAATTTTNTARRFSLRAPRSRDNSGSNTTSSGTGTGTGSFSQPASSTLAPPQPSAHLPSSHPTLPAPQHERRGSGRFFSSIAGLFRGGGNIAIGHSSGTEKWKTRTETNIRAVRRNMDSDSEDEAPTESPSRRLFSRRALHDASPPPSPTPRQKLRKRSPRMKEKDLGWISDGAVVRGRGAQKGSVKRRATLSTTRLPDPPVPTSEHTPSPSAASAVSSLVSASASSTPTRTKPNGKPKTDLRVEALTRSSTTDVSRRNSLRSSGSAMPVPRSLKVGERATSLPPSQSTPGFGVGRSNSLSHHPKSNSLSSASTPYRPSHTDAGRAGSSQLSLMAIVEGVTRQNRVAWDHANAGLPVESAIGAGAVGGLVSVRAPPPVTKYNVRGEGGRGIAFETVFAPGSVLAASSPASPPANSEPRRPTSLPPPARPLRSALRNHTPPPTPPKLLVIPSAPPRVVVEPSPPARTPSRKDPDDEGSDSESVASFRTVRESLDEEPVSAPASPALAVPGKDESDASTSTVSAGAGPGTGTGVGAGAVRRKSVRVSLQPTFSPTPPALDEDEDEDEAWERSGRPWGDEADGAAEGNGRERDFWADSSDEDEEYSKARRLLTRASKKRW